jgi:HD-like signal output (HDOD) protein
MPLTAEHKAADRWLDRIDTLHSAPQVVQQVLALTSDPDFDAKALVACIESDPGLAAKILRVVNSSHYGLRQPAASVRKAALYLGQRSLRLLVLTFGLVEALTRGRGRAVYTNCWKRSLLIASLASRLARRKDGVDTQEAYTAGLLADVGVLVFMQSYGDEYAAVHELHEHGPALVEAEREAFGCGHSAIGSRLLARWEMPGALVEAVATHHDGVTYDDLALTVRAADVAAGAFQLVQSPRIAAIRELLQNQFGMDTNAFIDLVLSARGDFDQMADLFGLSGPAGFDCDQIIAEARRRHVQLSLETALDMDGIEGVCGDAAAPV